MDKFSQEVRSRIMTSIKGKGTKGEMLLGKALWSKGLRYRKNDKRIIGSPDFTFKKYKVAIFCDGEFWHGKNWLQKKARISTNADYWIAKIEKNMLRDIKVDRILFQHGWVVLRFWDKDIQKNLSEYVSEIVDLIYERQNR